MRLSHITKSFGRTRAVDAVSLEIRGGEILALVGENGAGKTTLMRIAAGELAADSGEIADRDVVGFVHQHFLLVPELTIAENLALIAPGFRFATTRTLEREAKAVIAASGIVLGDVSRRVAELSVGEKAKLELIKAIARKPATLILDEPTSVLTPHEAEELFAVMRTLAASGTAIVFISHKLPEVLAVARRVVVMRKGKVVLDTNTPTAGDIANAMLPQSPLPPPGERVRVRGALAFERANLQVHEQEIVAIVGVAGNGQAELASQLRDTLPAAAHIPEDRTRDGVIAEMSIAENLALKSVRNAGEMIELYSIRAHGPEQRAGDLSGGNQQKVILARELAPRPRIIVAAEPTRGLDLEATRFVHQRLLEAASNGAAILLITSDLDEAFALADAMHVIYRGKLSDRLTPAEAAERVAGLMAGIA